MQDPLKKQIVTDIANHASTQAMDRILTILKAGLDDPVMHHTALAMVGQILLSNILLVMIKQNAIDEETALIAIDNCKPLIKRHKEITL